MITLKDIFDKQAALQKDWVKKDFPCIDPKLSMYYAFGLFTEIGEVFQADKSWKPFNVGPRNHEDVKEELTDCMLYLVNLMLAEGMTAEDIEKCYLKKYEKVVGRLHTSQAK